MTTLRKPVLTTEALHYYLMVNDEAYELGREAKSFSRFATDMLRNHSHAQNVLREHVFDDRYAGLLERSGGTEWAEENPETAKELYLLLLDCFFRGAHPDN